MNDLPTCPECGKSHLSVATRCPHCGHVFRREPFEQADFRAAAPRGRGWILGGLGLLAAAGVVWVLVSRSLPAPAPAPAERVARDPVPAEVPARDPVPVDSTPTAAPVVPESAVPPVPVPAAPADVQTAPRWTLNWANVREAADLGAAVTTILRPGERVEAGERVRGFVRVYRDSRPLGFVAASLLATTPPDSSQ